MTDIWALNGSYSTQPVIGNPSAIPELITPLNETMQLQNKSLKFYQLQAVTPVVTPVVLDFSTVHVLIVKAVGGHVRVRITSADGALAEIPVDGFLCLTTQSVPITAIDLLQDAGVLVLVQLFLGQLAQ